MLINYKESNQRVNQLAEDLVALQPDINKTQVIKLQHDIMELMFVAYESKGEKRNQYSDAVRYYGPIKRDVPVDMFLDMLCKLLTYSKKKNCWVFKPEKASFTTAFGRILHWKLSDYEKAKKKRFAFKEKLYDESGRQDGAMVEKWSNVGELMENIDKLYSSIDAQPEKSKGYFKGFFTFDTTKAMKSNKDLGECACEYGETLFSRMVVALLEYLMTGVFSCMRNIVENPVRNGMDLNKRGELLEGYFGKSHPTVNKYSQKYDELRNAIGRNLG